MVSGVAIESSGILKELSIPIKTPDVLVWLRKKFKKPGIQFQGKIVDPLNPQRWLSIFANVSDEDDLNNHALPSPFDEETYTGTIVVMAVLSEQDDYEKLATDYTDIKVEDYQTLYSEWTFDTEIEELEDAFKFTKFEITFCKLP